MGCHGCQIQRQTKHLWISCPFGRKEKGRQRKGCHCCFVNHSQTEEKRGRKKERGQRCSSSCGEDGFDEKKEEKKEEKKVEEPTFEILQNPCRVVRPQLNVISMEEPKKFKAIKDSSIGGIIMVKRVDGETGGDIVEPVTINKTLVENEDEPEPPEPFEYTE